MAEIRHAEVLAVLAGVLDLPVRPYADKFEFYDAVREVFWQRVEADLRPEIDAELRAALVARLEERITEELATEANRRCIEAARDVIVKRIEEERKLWREYDRNAPPKRRWWQRRETPKPSTTGMMGVG